MAMMIKVYSGLTGLKYAEPLSQQMCKIGLEYYTNLNDLLSQQHSVPVKLWYCCTPNPNSFEFGAM